MSAVAASALALVFGGGNALGAFDAGAFAAVAEAGLEPDHVAGASAGAITAVLVAGNPPERRVPALRAFWDIVSAPAGEAAWMGEGWRRMLQALDGTQARLLGRPGMFHPRPHAVLDPSAPPGLYDLAPLRQTLAGLVDLALLNDGPMRVSLLAVDLRTGEEVVFDNRAGRLTLEHVLASSALLPNFPPVAIDGRLLVDGGLAANTPAHLVLDPPRDGLVCLAIDPFPLALDPPATLQEAQQRQQDLLFASQTRRTLKALAGRWALEARLAPDRPLRGMAWRVEYRSRVGETALKGFDFGAAALDRRWQEGRRCAGAALAAWAGVPPSRPGLELRGPAS